MQVPPVVLLDVFSSGMAISRRVRRLGGSVTIVAPPGQWEARTRAAQVLHELPMIGWVRALTHLADEVPEAVVIPLSDRTCEFLLERGERLPPNLRFFERGSTAHRALMDKDTACEIARGAGVPVPFTVRLDHVEDLARLGTEVPWPCVAKPVRDHVFPTTPLSGMDDAARLLTEPLRAGCPVAVSQYVPGDDGHVEEVIQVRMADGSYPVRFGVHKLRQSPPGFGHTALGESSPLPEATEVARKVLDAAGFVGVAGVEVKRDPRTGERWFLEVNTRVPNQWGLGDACGVDATRRLVEVMAGRPVGEEPPLRPGVRFVAVEKDLPLLAQALKAEPLRRWPATAARHLRPYVGAGERTVLDLRDPAPAAAWARAKRGRVWRG